MLIREAKPSDVPKIISVLKASLGEDDLPLSEEIWMYKHENNPFGNSVVFIAEEEGIIAGVRAFMRWQWQKDEEIFSAFRAVDTATHPHFQGKGIFKKLTLKAVESGKTEGANFVFNTPNEKSRPGYLKMGWREVGKLKIGLYPTPFSIFNFSQPKLNYYHNLEASSFEIDKLCRTWNEIQKRGNKFFTPKSPQFLHWRFEENPLQDYTVYATKNVYLACYVKKRGRFNELRISECIFVNNKKVQKEIKKLIHRFTKEYKTHFVSFSPTVPFPNVFGWKGNIGPVFTLRELNLEEEDFVQIKQLMNWKYTLGDLELF